jgi:hypothetical protein
VCSFIGAKIPGGEVRDVKEVFNNFPAHCSHCHLHQICDQVLSCRKSFLDLLLVHMIMKQVAVILCISCCTTWQKFNMNHSF